MDKWPFLAGVQQELFFLPEAARQLAESGATGPRALDTVESAIRTVVLSDAHLEGLGILKAPRRDDDGNPGRPERDVVVRAMAEDCLDQMQQLGIADEEGRIAPEQLPLVEDRAWLCHAVLENYTVTGQDGTSRNVVGQLNNAFQTLGNEPPEREDEPLSAAYRRGLCLAEFMRLHFWMANLEPERDKRGPRPSRWAFGDLILPEREAALDGLDVGEGGIEYAALVMADAATDALLEHHKRGQPEEQARGRALDRAHALRCGDPRAARISRRRAVALPGRGPEEPAAAEQTADTPAMTLTARVLVGDDDKTDIAFPEPGHEIVPRALGIAAALLLNENHRRDLIEVYEAIGYDSRAAQKHRAALAEKRRRDEAAGKKVTEDDEITQDFRIAVRAIGLELIAGLFLSVLDSPAEARCPCRVLMEGEKAIPYGAAPQGNPDARADYGEFTVLAEVTTTLNLRKSDIAGQWTSAGSHVDAVTDSSRIYCLMVSRLGLDDKRGWQAAELAKAQAKQENGKPPPDEAESGKKDGRAVKETAEAASEPPPAGLRERPDVKFLVFDIEDMAEIAHKLHELYGEEGIAKKALTSDGLGMLLDEMHALTMEWIAGEDVFPPHWASDTFIKMLGKYASGKPIGDREAA